MTTLKTKIKAGKSTGYLTKRHNRWYIRYREKPNAQVLTRTLETTDYRTAVLEAEKVLKQLEEDKVGGFRLSELSEMWLKANTRKSHWYIKAVKNHWKVFVSFFENGYAQSLTRHDADRFQTYLETLTFKGKLLSPSTIYTRLRIIMVVWNWNRDRDNVAEDIFYRTKLPTPKVRQGYLTTKMLMELINSIGDPVIQAYIEFLTYSGWRPNELRMLKWEDVKEDFIVMHDTKTGDYTVKNRSRMKEALEKIKANSEILGIYVCSERGRQLSYQQYLRRIKRCFTNAGFPEYGAYHLRHSFCTNLHLMGRDIYEINKLARHKNINTTIRYTKLDTNKIQDDDLDFMKDVIEEYEDSQNLFTKADDEEEERLGLAYSYNKNIKAEMTKAGTAFYSVPCEEGFRKIADAEDHFDNCFKCHKIAGQIVKAKN